MSNSENQVAADAARRIASLTGRAKELAQEGSTASDAPYPSYVLSFELPGMTPDRLQVRGPHTEMFVSANPELKLKVEVAHNPTNATVPNLSIIVTRVP